MAHFQSNIAFVIAPRVLIQILQHLFRVSDYVHHPIDVLAGLVIGVGVGIVFGLQTVWSLRRLDRKSNLLSEEGRQHLASVRSEVAADRAPNGQV